MAKKIYNWSKVSAGDIISFRYKGKTSESQEIQTLLVFNPRLPIKRKDNTTNFHLVGLKLEQQGNIPIIRNKPVLVQLLESIGDVEVVHEEDEIYRVIIKDVGNRGVKPAVYNRLKRDINRYGVYRTYDYDLARKSQVFLEPIELPVDFKRKLVED